MSRDEYNLLLHEIICDAHGATGIALVIAFHQPHLLSQYATLGVQVIYGLLRATPELLAKWRQITAHWTGNSDHDFIAGRLRRSGCLRPASTSRSKQCQEHTCRPA